MYFLPPYTYEPIRGLDWNWRMFINGFFRMVFAIDIPPDALRNIMTDDRTNDSSRVISQTTMNVRKCVNGHYNATWEIPTNREITKCFYTYHIWCDAKQILIEHLGTLWASHRLGPESHKQYDFDAVCASEGKENMMLVFEVQVSSASK